MSQLYEETWPEAFHRVGDQVFFEGCDLGEILSREGTPTWIASAATVKSNYDTFRQAFASFHNRLDVAYSIKANNNVAIIGLLSKLGCMIDTSVEYEHYAAELSGVPTADMIVNGNGKSLQGIEWAVKSGVRQINVDSLDEVARIQVVSERHGVTTPCLVRIHPTHERLLARDPEFASMVTVGEGKFGAYISTGEAFRVVEAIISSPNLDFKGVHSHLGFSGYTAGYTPQRELMHHRDATLEITSFVTQIEDVHGIRVERIDLGGGFRSGQSVLRSTPRSGHDLASFRVPQITEYSELILDALDCTLNGGLSELEVLQFEIGGYLVANAFVLGVEVLDVKRVDGLNPKQYVSVDASAMMFVSRLRQHTASPVVMGNGRNAKNDWDVPVTLVGQTCFYDGIIENVILPDVQEGDILYLLNQGAYHEVQSTQFNAFPRPSVVLIEGDQCRVIRSRETIESIFSRDVV